MVLGSFEPVFRALEEADIVLTPHLLDPLSPALKEGHEVRALRWGVFNLGFIGVRRSERTTSFLQWWNTRLQRHCLNNERGLNGDQLSDQSRPAYFPEASLSLRHPGLNVGYWNLHERRPSWNANAGRFVVSGEPLVFFHFSHWDIRNPERASIYDRPEGLEISVREACAALGTAYRELLFASGHPAMPLRCETSRVSRTVSPLRWRCVGSSMISSSLIASRNISVRRSIRVRGFAVNFARRGCPAGLVASGSGYEASISDDVDAKCSSCCTAQYVGE